MTDRIIARFSSEALGLVSCGACRAFHDSSEAFVVVEDGAAMIVCPSCAVPDAGDGTSGDGAPTRGAGGDGSTARQEA